MFSEDKNTERASLLEKRQKMMLKTSGASALTTVFTRHNEDFGIRRKTGGELKPTESSVNVVQDEKNSDRTTAADGNAINECETSSTLDENDFNNSAEHCTDCTGKSSSQCGPHLNERTGMSNGRNDQYKQDIILQNETSNQHELGRSKDEGGLNSRAKVSLVSEMYGDTDSDSSK